MLKRIHIWLILIVLPSFLNAQLTISGHIEREDGVPVEGVLVFGGELGNTTTDENGYYEFQASEGANGIILPYANSDHSNGITLMDSTIVHDWILTLGGLDSPYKKLAADVNNSGVIQAFDASLISQLVNGELSEFPNTTSWIFVPSNYVFINPDYPVDENIPEIFNVNNLTESIVYDWVAVKIGDVDYSASTVLNQNPPTIVSGQITTMEDVPCSGFIVSCPAVPGCQTITDENGYYELEIYAPSAFSLKCENQDYLNGITTFDLAAISSQLQGNNTLNTIAKQIAADVNNSGSITTADLTTIQQLSQGIIEAFPNNDSWRLYPKDQVFANPADPFTEPINSVFQITGPDPVTIDYVALKIGDINCSANTFLTETGNVTGEVFFDQNDNCILDDSDIGLNDWIIAFEGSTTYYATSNEEGLFDFNLPIGTYDVNLIAPNTLWQPCPTQTITILANESISIDLGTQSMSPCPLLEVDVSTSLLRRCMNNNYFVHYCNKGTDVAENAIVEVEFDDFMTFNSSEIASNFISGNTYSFEVGDVPAGECGSFWVNVEVSCDAVLGQTHCVSAHITPDSLCLPAAPEWDGSNLEINGFCEGDSVKFQIINTGENMQTPLEYVVIEDIMIQFTSNPLLLNNNETIPITLPANGSTWRVEMPQAPNHPTSSLITASIEGCGTNNDGEFSVGIIPQFPQNDDFFEDVDCRQNIGSYDPNDKMAFPKGVCASNLINANTDLEYQIRFQNTGTDTAFNVYILDTLSQHLEPSSIVPGASSHDYDFELIGQNIVRFSFQNIMLPDSNVNVEASQGYVQFSISQRPDLPTGTQIQNSAAIYFDANEPVITNTYQHEIGEGFIEAPMGDLSISGTITRWNTGEPIEGVEVHLTNNCAEITDEDGFYLFENIEEGEFYVITPYKGDDIKNGVTVLDLLKLRLGILGLTELSPQQLLAGNMSGFGFGLTTFDLVQIMELLLQDAIIAQPWLFIPADYEFPDPLDIAVPDAIQIDTLQNNLQDQDFVAIKKGDLVSESEVPQSDLNPHFYLIVEQNCPEGPVEVEVRANNFTDISAFQFEIAWDESILSYTGVSSDSLLFFDDHLFSAPFQNTDGQVRIMWFQGSTAGVTFEDNSTIMSFHFDPVGAPGSSTEVSLVDSSFIYQVIAANCAITQPTFQGITVSLSTLGHVTPELEIIHASTANSNDGAIQITDIQGGIAPYLITFNGEFSWGPFENLAPGDYLLNIQDALGCVWEETITISFESASGDIFSEHLSLSINPNPVSKNNETFIHITSSREQHVDLQLLDLTGKVIRSKNLQLKEGAIQVPILMPSTPGIYFLEVTLENQTKKSFKILAH